MRIGVVGATGFVGGSLMRSGFVGIDLIPLKAPRLKIPKASVDDVRRAALDAGLQAQLKRDFLGIDVLVNAAGMADPQSRDRRQLWAANAALPLALAVAACDANVARFVHVSSAAVQGRLILSEKFESNPGTDYATSKWIGECLLHELEWDGTVTYRPASIHGASRPVTQRIVRMASSSRLAVAYPGLFPTPQAFIGNVAHAVHALATSSTQVAPIVIHPSEGLTTASFLRLMGEREPRKVPLQVARLLTRTANSVARLRPSMTAHVRRLEMVMFGQHQESSWLDGQGWRAPFAPQQWSKSIRREILQ